MNEVTKTVYGIYYPETRKIIDELWSSRPHEWYEANYSQKQDDMHRACLSRWREWVKAAGVTLGPGFAHEYPTAGANEAIHSILAVFATRGGKRIHVFDGEYEGYLHLARALNIEVIVHVREGDRYLESFEAHAQKGDLFWLSEPSAIDGNSWSGLSQLRNELANRGMKLVIDLTYVGAITKPLRVDLDHETVSAVLWSLSKPFGVYYHRVGGLVSREEIPTLRGHHWFKNLFSVHLGERLMATYPAIELPLRYQKIQREAIARAIENGLISAASQPSDVVMLAHDWRSSLESEYKRGSGLRYCLSPLMDRLIQK